MSAKPIEEDQSAEHPALAG